MDEDDKTVARMHELVANVLELLSELKPQEQAAVVYVLATHPKLVPHMPGVIEASLRQQFKLLQQTCQCPTCKAERAQA